MKYFHVILISLFILPAISRAQQSNWQIGVHGDVQQMYFIVENDRLGVHLESEKEWIAAGGITVKYDLSDMLTLRSGIGYERKGGSHTVIERTPQQPSGTGREVQTYIYYDYLALPVQTELNFRDRIPFYLVAGVNLSTPLNVSERQDRPSSLDPNPVQVAVIGGLGSKFSVTNKLSLNIEISHQKSISDPVTDMLETTDFDLMSTSASLGIMYNL